MRKVTAQDLDYSAGVAARATGLSPYMVDYLCRHRLVTPSGSGLRGRGRLRKYTFADIVVLRVVAKLLRQGISISAFRRGFLSAKQRKLNIDDLVARKYLVTDGLRVYLQNDGVLERIDTGQLSFAFVLDLDPVRKDLVRRLRAV